VFIRLTSPDGSSSTEARGVENPSGSGHYLATIAVPAGGVGLVEVGLFGESCVNGACARSDILFELPATQRVPVAVAAGPVDPPRAQMPVVHPEDRAVPLAGNAAVTPAVAVVAGAAVAVLAIGLLWRVRADSRTGGGRGPGPRRSPTPSAGSPGSGDCRAG
jgi:hypothetical protein